MTNQTQALADALRERRVRMLNYILEWQRDEPVEDWWPYQRDYKLFSDNLSLIIEALSQYEKSDTDRDQLREAAEECRATAKRLRDCPNCDCSMAYEATLWDQRANRFEDAALASKTAIDPATVRTRNCDGLEDHFPTGLRSKLGVTKDTLRWYSDGVIQCECECGASFAGTDEQEVRQLWAEHALAAIRALGKDQ